MSTGAINHSQVAALLKGLGIDPMQLAAELANATQTPAVTHTVASFLPHADAAAPARSVATYRSYWKQFVAEYGDAALPEITTEDVALFAKRCGERAVVRRNSRGGYGATDAAVTAMRSFFRAAVKAGFVPVNPADDVPRIRRPQTGRRALTAAEFAELHRVTQSGGDDPLLDTLLLRFHAETGARRGGGLALRICDLDDHAQLVLLREKGGTAIWQPVSRSLIVALRSHATARGAVVPEDKVFRRRNGAPISARRYLTLTNRWHRELPWAAKYDVSPHWIRHTAGTAVDRLAGRAVAGAFLRHVPGGDGVTGRYTTATIAEVAAAVAELTGEPHPLAPDKRK